MLRKMKPVCTFLMRGKERSKLSRPTSYTDIGRILYASLASGTIYNFQKHRVSYMIRNAQKNWWYVNWSKVRITK